VITELDDYPVHQTALPVAVPLTADPNFYDRYFFNGYSDDGSLFFSAAMGLYPNRSILDGAFSVAVEGVQTSLHVSRRAPHERRDTTCGPLRIEVLEPLKRLRVTIDQGDLTADLTFTARSAPIQEPRTLAYSGPKPATDSTRMTQFGRWEGHIDVAGQRHVVDGLLGCRDRSWGTRPISGPAVGAPQAVPQLFWLWAPIQLSDRCLHFDVWEHADGRRWHEFGVEWPDHGEPTVMRGVEHRIDWEVGTRRARSAEVVLTRPSGSTLQVGFEPLSTFQMLGVGYLHPEWSHGAWKGEYASSNETWRVDELDPLNPHHLHVQQLCRVRVGDEVGTGVFEQLVLGPHEPSGFQDLIDGARAR
jgi:hypothetical protein